MKRLVLGVIGHVDHGKTALVRALTGTDTDRLPEEKRRGISIALGFAHLTTAEATVDLIDMPGHERFVRTMVSGATGLDAVMLVVAANEGIQPQTVEHVDIAALLGLRRAVVAVTKIDLAAPERVAVAAETLLRDAGIEVVATVLTSAVRGDGIERLRAEIAQLGVEARPGDGVAFLPIDRAFTVAGHGTVVTGTLRGAAIAAGDTLDLAPAGRPVRVRGVQIRGVLVAVAAPGQRVAVNLRDVAVDEVRRGSVLSAQGALPASRWLTIAIRAVAGAPVLANGAVLQALAGTVEVAVRLRLLDRDALQPGEQGMAQLHCREPICLPAREHVVLRLPAPVGTVAGGVVLEPQARRRRRDAAGIARLAAMAGATPREMVLDEVRAAGAAGVVLADLSRLSALAPAAVAETLVAGGAVVGQTVAVTETALDDVVRTIPGRLIGEGLSRDRLADDSSLAVVEEALRRLLAAGVVREVGGLVVLPRPEVERAQGRAQAALSAEVAEAFRRGGLTPPDPVVVVTGVEQKRVVDQLLRAGVIVRAHDSGQKRHVLFHQDAIDEARRKLSPLLAHPPGLLVSEAGAALGISRKFSIPLLAHLDEIRFTRRVQDRRILAVVAS